MVYGNVALAQVAKVSCIFLGRGLVPSDRNGTTRTLKASKAFKCAIL